jgi:hypothetical protein
MFRDPQTGLSLPYSTDLCPAMNYAEACYLCDQLNLLHGENGSLFGIPMVFRPAILHGNSWGFLIEPMIENKRAPETELEPGAEKFILGFAEGLIHACRTAHEKILNRTQATKVECESGLCGTFWDKRYSTIRGNHHHTQCPMFTDKSVSLKPE